MEKKFNYIQMEELVMSVIIQIWKRFGANFISQLVKTELSIMALSQMMIRTLKAEKINIIFGTKKKIPV